MRLVIHVDEEKFAFDVPQEILDDGEQFFAKMDRDMDKGWTMSRYFVEHPDTVQRCQIAADKILTAMHTGNRRLAMLMAGYILSRMPGVRGVEVDTSGEMFNTQFITDEAPPPFLRG